MPIPSRLIDLRNPLHIKQLIKEIEGPQNRERRKEAFRAEQALEGNQREYVKEELKKLYPYTHAKFRVGDINIPKKITDKQNKAYKSKPIRSCKSDEETESLEDMYSIHGFHRAFKLFDRVFNYHRYACFWLTWQNPEERDAEEGKYIPHILKPYEYDLVRDEVSGEPVIFSMNYPDADITGGADGIEQSISENQKDTSAESRIYSMWNRKDFVKVRIKKSKGEVEKHDDVVVEYIAQKANELERLPIEFMQKDTSVDYPVANNLYKQSIDWNVGFSDLKTAASTQGHGQLVIKHPEGQKMKSIHMGMHTSISLPQSKKPDSKPTEADYISASPDLIGQLDVLKFDLGNILDDNNIKAKGVVNASSTQDFSSGFDRLLSEADVQDLVEDNQSRYSEELEKGVFKLLKAYEEAMNQTTFSKTDELEINFEKPKVLISDKETLENLRTREELGLLLPHEKHMVINPNLSEEQAKEREEEIQAIKKERMQEMVDMMPEEKEEDDDEDKNPIGE